MLGALNIRAGGTTQVVRFGRVNKNKKTDTRPPFRDEKELKATGRGTTDEICSADGKVALISWYDNKVVHGVKLCSFRYSIHCKKMPKC